MSVKFIGLGGADHVTTKIQAVLDAADAGETPITIAQGSVYREILKLAHKDGCDMIVMASAKGDFPNYEIGPNLAHVVRNAHCTVLVVRD